MDKLASKQDTALAEVDSVKQAAITAIEDFQSIDTSNWQKHKLTEDDGYIPRMDNVDMSDLDSFMEIKSKLVYLFDPINTPTPDNDNGYLTIIARSSSYAQAIFSPINDNTVYMNNKIGSSYGWDGWKSLSGVTRTVLFEGSSKGIGSLINLKEDLNGYASITVSGHYPGGRFNETHTLYNNADVVVNRINLSDSDGGKPTSFETQIEIKNDSTLLIEKEMKNNLFETDAGSNTETNFEINYIMGWT